MGDGQACFDGTNVNIGTDSHQIRSVDEQPLIEGFVHVRRQQRLEEISDQSRLPGRHRELRQCPRTGVGIVARSHGKPEAANIGVPFGIGVVPVNARTALIDVSDLVASDEREFSRSRKSTPPAPG